MNSETTKNALPHEESTVKRCLTLLDELGVRDSMLESQHGLCRKTLYHVRHDGLLRKDKHRQYFIVLMRILCKLMEKARLQFDADRYRRIRDGMFDIMLHETGII